MRCSSISTWRKSVRNRWGILVLSFLLVCGVGILAMWLLAEPLYLVTGAIRVVPVVPNILTGEADKGEIFNYEAFVYTQAQIVTGSRVVQRVADDLSDRKLSFFGDERAKLATKQRLKSKGAEVEFGPASILKWAISDGVIRAAHAPRTELLKVTMKSTEPEEAKQIVNAFINAYMAVEARSSIDSEAQVLSVLEDQKRRLAQKLRDYNEQKQRLAQEYDKKSDKEMYDTICRRINKVKMQQKRPARFTVAYNADIAEVRARRVDIKYVVPLIFGAVAFGMLMAFLRDKTGT